MLKVINSVIKYIDMRRAYNRTYRELSKLSDKELLDIGLARYDIAEIARESATGVETNVVKTENNTMHALKALFSPRVALR